MRTKRCYRMTFIFLLLGLGWIVAASGEAAQRESVLDKVEHVEQELVEMPAVTRLCDKLKMDGKKVDVGGCKLYCEVEGKGTPMVLLHGGPGATHHYFHPHFCRAAEWAQVVYYDQRGCGLSDYERGEGYSVDQAVGDLEGLRQALGVEKWVVLGHSYGGALAQCYAVKHSERVLGLVLVCSADDGHSISTGNSRQYDFITNAEAQRINGVRREKSIGAEMRIFNIHLNGDWKRQNFYRPTPEELARMAQYEWKQDERFRGEIIPTLQSVYLEGLFEGCPFPVLIMESKWDLTWGAEKAENLHGCFPGSRLAMFEMAGHSPFSDAPDDFFAALKDFVSELRAPAEAGVAEWKATVAKKVAAAQAAPEYQLRAAGWGKASSEKLASAYSKDWLETVKDDSLLLRLGFALYDEEEYEEALAAFEKMAQVSPVSDRITQAMAGIWQGHMLDLLGRHKEAKAVYRKVAELNASGQVRHDQYGIAYKPTDYATYRLKHPFTRVENSEKD